MEAAIAERRTLLGLSLLCLARSDLAHVSGTVPDCEAAVLAAESYRQLAPSGSEPVETYAVALRIAADDLARFLPDVTAAFGRFLVDISFNGRDGTLDHRGEVRAAREVHPGNPWLVTDELHLLELCVMRSEGGVARRTSGLEAEFASSNVYVVRWLDAERNPASPLQCLIPSGHDATEWLD